MFTRRSFSLKHSQYVRLEQRRFLSANAPCGGLTDSTFPSSDWHQADAELLSLAYDSNFASAPVARSIAQISTSKARSIDSWFELGGGDFFVDSPDFYFERNAFRQFEEAIFTPYAYSVPEPLSRILSLSTFNDTNASNAFENLAVAESNISNDTQPRTSANGNPITPLIETQSSLGPIESQGVSANAPTTTQSLPATTFLPLPNIPASSELHSFPLSNSTDLFEMTDLTSAQVVASHETSPSVTFPLTDGQVRWQVSFSRDDTAPKYSIQGASSIYSLIDSGFRDDASLPRFESTSTIATVISSVQTSSHQNLLAYTSLSSLEPLESVDESTSARPPIDEIGTALQTQQLSAMGRLFGSLIDSDAEKEIAATPTLVSRFGSAIVITVAASWYFTYSRSMQISNAPSPQSLGPSARSIRLKTQTLAKEIY